MPERGHRLTLRAPATKKRGKLKWLEIHVVHWIWVTLLLRQVFWDNWKAAHLPSSGWIALWIMCVVMFLPQTQCLAQFSSPVNIVKGNIWPDSSSKSLLREPEHPSGVHTFLLVKPHLKGALKETKGKKDQHQGFCDNQPWGLFVTTLRKIEYLRVKVIVSRKNLKSQNSASSIWDRHITFESPLSKGTGLFHLDKLTSSHTWSTSTRPPPGGSLRETPKGRTKSALNKIIPWEHPQKTEGQEDPSDLLQ